MTRYRIIVSATSSEEYEIRAETQEGAETKALDKARRDMRWASSYEIEDVEELDEAVGGENG